MELWTIQQRQFINMMIDAEDLWEEVVGKDKCNKGKFK